MVKWEKKSKIDHSMANLTEDQCRVLVVKLFWSFTMGQSPECHAVMGSALSESQLLGMINRGGGG